MTSVRAKKTRAPRAKASGAATARGQIRMVFEGDRVRVVQTGRVHAIDVLTALKAGDVSASAVTADLPQAAKALSVEDVLLAGRYVNLPRAHKLVDSLGLNAETPLAKCAPAQRKSIAKTLAWIERAERRRIVWVTVGAEEAFDVEPTASYTPAGWRNRVLSDWERVLGKLLDEEEATERAGSPDELAALEADGLVFALPAGKHVAYPEFQFLAPDFQLGPLHALITEKGCVSPWTAASWLVTKNQDLEEMTPLDWLEAEDDRERLYLVAERDAHRMAQ